MKKILGVGFVLVALLFVPLEVEACKTCDVPAFWDPNCAHPGCTYCAACSICCGGDPGAGGNCELYCGGAASANKTTGISLSEIFLTTVNVSREAPELLTGRPPAECSPVRQ
jgi:hypothetical protein